MSNLIHCDGPSCDVTKDPDYDLRALAEGGWLKVSQGEGVRKLDFHSNACLAAWVDATGPSTTEVTGR